MDQRPIDSDQNPGRRGCSADAATVTVSPGGIITGWSEEARRLMGYSAADVVGSAAADLLASAERPDAVGLRLLDSEEWSGTAALRHRDGHRLTLTLHAYPSLDGEGKTQGFIVTATTDASESEYDRRMVEWAFAQSSIALSTFDKGSRRWQLNAVASENAGAAGPEKGEVRGSPNPDVLDAHHVDEGLLRDVERVAETATPIRHEHFTPVPSSSGQYASIIEMWPVRDPSTGEVRGVGTAHIAGGEERGARQRLALLNEAGARIGTTLDVERTAQELADLAVPRFADFVSVDLLDSVTHGEEPVLDPVEVGAALRRVAHQSSLKGVPDAVTGLGTVRPAFPLLARCLATGRPVLSEMGDPGFLRWLTQDDVRRARVRAYGFHSVIATPLQARGVTLGVAVFARRNSSDRFEQDDLILAEELAGRAAVAVDNARRYTRERATALTLQRSLLSRVPSKQAAVEVAVRYLPADTGAGVGGDWFDVVPLSATRVALVVGDVVGHGIHASAAMGRLRTAVRTLADVDLPPDELLTHLDDLVIHLTSDDGGVPAAETEDGEIGATCLYAVYDPVSRICTLASAGHPPPAVLLPDGTVSLIQLTPGPPLGIGGLPFEATEVELPEGSLLALYTDGLIEAGHDVGAGLDRLCKVLATPDPSLEATCDAVLAALLPGSPADDAALLLARTRALHADQVAAWALPSDPAIVSDARAQVSRQLTAWGLEEAEYVTELVVSELVTNAIRYGMVPIGLRLIRDRSLICEVSDASSTAPHLRRARIYDEGGRGLHMIAQLTEGWGTRQTPMGKTIWAEQPLPELTTAEHTDGTAARSASDTDESGATGGGTHTLGLVYPPFGRSRYYTEVHLAFIGRVAEAANRYGYDVLLSPSDTEGDPSFQRMIGERRVDGVIVMEINREDDRVDYLADAAFPFVTIGRNERAQETGWVDLDYAGLAGTCVRHLADLGHRRIAFVNKSEALFEMGYGAARLGLEGYTQAMTELGLDPRSYFCGDDLASGEAVLERIFQDDPATTSLVTLNEPSLEGVYRGLTRHGRSVPRDFSVVGVAASRWAELVTPQLTAAGIPAGEMGRIAVDLMMERLTSPSSPPRHVLLEPLIFLRASTGLRRPAPGTEPEMEFPEFDL